MCAPAEFRCALGTYERAVLGLESVLRRSTSRPKAKDAARPARAGRKDADSHRAAQVFGRQEHRRLRDCRKGEAQELL